MRSISMDRFDQLPEPPPYRIVQLETCVSGGEGFLSRVSRRLCTESPSGERSRDFIYDEVDRRCLDAVVIVPHFWGDTEQGQRVLYVVLRSAIRPPIALRSANRSPIKERDNRGLWEFPAGLVEQEECSADGLARAAARELWEETGFRLLPERLQALGPSTFPAPGVIAERHFFFHARVDPGKHEAPPLDGSPLEEAGRVLAVPYDAARAAVRAGQLEDAKTELGLYRLQAALLDTPAHFDEGLRDAAAEDSVESNEVQR